MAAATMMDIIVRNIKSWKHEFSTAPMTCEQARPTYSPIMGDLSERNTANVSTRGVIKEIQNRKERLLAMSGVHQSKPISSDTVAFLRNSLDCNRIVSECKKYPSPLAVEKVKNILNDHISKKPNHQLNESSRMQTSSPIIVSSSSDDGMDHDNDEEEEFYSSSYDSNMSEEYEWKVVTNNKPSRSDQSSMFCYSRALCMLGSKCKDKHTKKEKEAFEARRVAKTANDKEFSDTKFRTELCKVNVLHNLGKCRFAHGTEQVICRNCFEVGHKKDSCINNEKILQSPTKN